jgi:hypothetical protein
MTALIQSSPIIGPLLADAGTVPLLSDSSLVPILVNTPEEDRHSNIESVPCDVDMVLNEQSGKVNTYLLRHNDLPPPKDELPMTKVAINGRRWSSFDPAAPAWSARRSNTTSSYSVSEAISIGADPNAMLTTAVANQALHHRKSVIRHSVVEPSKSEADERLHELRNSTTKASLVMKRGTLFSSLSMVDTPDTTNS